MAIRGIAIEKEPVAAHGFPDILKLFPQGACTFIIPKHALACEVAPIFQLSISRLA
tara:strand:- start:1580 stop:1747 length:168 start_codon:yes stop_codon:yes gene_type:complete